MCILADDIKSLLDFTEPEFDRDVLVVAANPQLQQIAGLLFLQPAINPPGHFSTIPVHDDVAGPQARLGSGAFGINFAHDEGAVRFMLHEKT